MPVFDPAPERVVLTNRHHLREGGTFADELGGVPILGPEAGMHEFGRGRSAGGRLRGGRRGRRRTSTVKEMGAIALDDHVLHIRTRGEGLLAFGDAIIVWDGELTFVPDFLMDEPDKVKKDTVERAVPLLALDFDHLLFAHGDPVIGARQNRPGGVHGEPPKRGLRSCSLRVLAGAVAQLEERSAGSRKVRGSRSPQLHLASSATRSAIAGAWSSGMKCLPGTVLISSRPASRLALSPWSDSPSAPGRALPQTTWTG